MLRAVYAMLLHRNVDFGIVPVLGAYTEGPSRRRKRRLYISAVRYRSIELCNAVSNNQCECTRGVSEGILPRMQQVVSNIISCDGAAPPILAASGVGAFGPKSRRILCTNITTRRQ
jgi:hypothetical protein